ncbi:fungal-specific transcription factor domain-containing protein [Penicillium canariense]|uniref:Fungal-specific transcription factor domain-containing protein n=1 Tax=Penicillium canariense TaxID=189055 RepID=A0A9W9I4I5_9EURO|nr:fungal-specific transcription factor domain-containing protein [Penicillium canariense]KAJ5166698.1 fungal-specific transcription factor domain-containing protein [Penicillium canariense]
MSICFQLQLDQNLTIKDERTVFFLGNLAWLDIIRAFSVPDRLCFTQELRKKLLSLCDLRFEAVNGCPRELVLIIGEILEHAKAHSSSSLATGNYNKHIRTLIQKLYIWDASRCFYPDEDPLWHCIAEAFRHTCILRAWRLLDPTESATEPHIQESVTAILDSLATVPGNSPLIELTVMPLFMAGADSLSPHSRHYVLLRLGEIKARSEMGISAPQTLLKRVWQARAQQPRFDKRNIPWMDFTHNSDSMHQDDYLII